MRKWGASNSSSPHVRYDKGFYGITDKVIKRFSFWLHFKEEPLTLVLPNIVTEILSFKGTKLREVLFGYK
jgi:hypothetical protein